MQQILTSEFLQYLASAGTESPADGDINQLPSLTEISAELGIGVASLREQLEVAEALGFVEVRPRTGIRRLPYSFTPAVSQSLGYALELDRNYFEAFAQLRNQVEAAFWYQAVERLTPADHSLLQNLMERAWKKLAGEPIHIPHNEHRLLHLTIFSRLDNPFVQGILEAYWQAYETVGLNVYADYDYLQKVWQYHQEMVDAIGRGDFASGYTALIQHTDLIYHRPSAGRLEPAAGSGQTLD